MSDQAKPATIPRENLLPFVVIEAFRASRYYSGDDAPDEERFEDQTTIEFGELLSADPDAWKGMKRKDQTIVRFFREKEPNLTYHASQELFSNATKLAESDVRK